MENALSSQRRPSMMTFNINDTAVILIDHQVGTNTWASTTPLPLLQRNVIILVTGARSFGVYDSFGFSAGLTEMLLGLAISSV